MTRNKSVLSAAFIITTIMLVSFFVPPYVHAMSSTNVSLERDLYRDMELWAAEGLITSNLHSIRPFTRGEIGKQLAAALHRCALMDEPSAACRDIQNRYANCLRRKSRPFHSASGTFLKPAESVSISYSYLDGPFSTFNREGLPEIRGHNALVKFQSHARAGRYFSFFVEPAFVFNEYRTFDNHSSRTELRLHKGYAKFTAFNLEIQAGRDSLWWGPSYHGSLLMSNNARPFDMIKISNPEPVLLPWFFSYLGPVQFNIIFSQLNDDRERHERANPFLYGVRLGLAAADTGSRGVTACHVRRTRLSRQKHMKPDHLFKIIYAHLSENSDEVNQQLPGHGAHHPAAQKISLCRGRVEIHRRMGRRRQRYST